MELVAGTRHTDRGNLNVSRAKLGHAVARWAQVLPYQDEQPAAEGVLVLGGQSPSRKILEMGFRGMPGCIASSFNHHTVVAGPSATVGIVAPGTT